MVHEDNAGALHLANNPVTTPNSKHIDIRHHFIRERVANGEFRVVHVRSDSMLTFSPNRCTERHFARTVTL